MLGLSQDTILCARITGSTGASLNGCCRISGIHWTVDTLNGERRMQHCGCESHDLQGEKSAMAVNKPLAEAVRKACLEAALHAYEDAGISGLCQEGRWEIAVQAIRELD